MKKYIIIACLCFLLTSCGKEEYYTCGSYEQDNDISNGSEPIEWIVIDGNTDGTLLLSRYGLTIKPFNDKQTETTWEECSLREWLNDEFLHEAFNDDELRKIIFVEDGFNKVFILNENEYNNLEKKYRKCQITDYARQDLADLYPNSYSSYEKAPLIEQWWLRSQGYEPDWADTADRNGTIGVGMHVDYPQAVRPAIWIKNE